ncbi:MAG TPA: hypothetical protein VK013_01355 [Myxococcaceae bacterium]|nr:hypothetical protein [Myxococcaceae bacterium]
MSVAVRTAGALLLLALGPACAPAMKGAVLPDATLQALQGSRDAFLAGPVQAMHPVRTFEDRDFAYAAALSPDGTRIAWVHLGGDGFRLAVADVERHGEDRADVLLNPVEFDVEGLAFTPDGTHLVTAGRDGALRLSAAGDATLVQVALAERPLVSLAVHPSGTWLAAGDDVGGLHFYSLPELQPLGSAAVHTDEVRGVAFAVDGRLVSGSWDRSVAVHGTRVQTGPVREVLVQAQQGGEVPALWAHLNGRSRLLLGVDGRLPISVLTGEAARAGGIDPAALTGTRELPTALGVQLAKVAPAQQLAFRELPLVMDVAICDACVPKGVQGVLAAPFLEGVALRFENGGALARLSLREHLEAPPVPRVELTPLARHSLKHHVNAVALDAAGTRLAVALSETPAKRTREIYQREKDGVIEPQAPGNVARVVSLDAGEVIFETTGHRGVVSAVALSPDGETLASGGWDKRVRLHTRGEGEVGGWSAGWSIRQLRFSRDGRRLVAAAWTPVKATGNQRSDPAVQLFLLDYRTPVVHTRVATGP